MKTLKKTFYIIFALCVLHWPTVMVNCAITGNDAGSSSSGSKAVGKGQQSSSSILGSIYHKSRQSRCVTCYEDRRYGDDRTRYYGSYSSRSGDDRTSSWYYPSYDRYDDRGYRGSEYDRYGSDRYGSDRIGADRYGADRYGADRYGSSDRYGSYRDDRYASRPPYDRYDTRTRGGAYDRPSGYERGESRGYGYDNRDRYYSDYYGRDRYYDRPKYGAAGTSSAAGYGGYERDYYDRYSSRYDYRPYRPWDDSYSSGYGALLDRGSNLIGVEPVKADENANNSDQQEANGDASSSTDKRSENNGQNS